MMTAHILSTTSSSMRSEPAHEAEQISRLLLCERFEVLREADEGRWLFGRGPDGYEGWVRAWHLLPDPGHPAPDRSVTARWSRALAEAREGSEVLLDLSFGTRLAPKGPPEKGFIPWILPDGRRAWTPEGDLEPIDAGGSDAFSRLEIRGHRLLGIPYEWGGRSSAGLDCSAFIQLLFASLGLNLPRDARQQVEHGRPASLENPRLWSPGDLIFFGSERIEHVGLWLGGGRLLHARGELRVERLDAKGQLPGEGRPGLAARRSILP